MKTKAVRLYGVNDIRLEEFELPEITKEEVLIRVDMTDVLSLMENHKINPGAMVSHILGLNAVSDTLFAMEKPSGAKKVCYNELDLPLIAISDLKELGKENELYRVLGEIVERNGGIWCAEAEAYLLKNF